MNSGYSPRIFLLVSMGFENSRRLVLPSTEAFALVFAAHPLGSLYMIRYGQSVDFQNHGKRRMFRTALVLPECPGTVVHPGDSNEVVGHGHASMRRPYYSQSVSRNTLYVHCLTPSGPWSNPVARPNRPDLDREWIGCSGGTRSSAPGTTASCQFTSRFGPSTWFGLALIGVARERCVFVVYSPVPSSECLYSSGLTDERASGMQTGVRPL